MANSVFRDFTRLIIGFEAILGFLGGQIIWQKRMEKMEAPLFI